MNDDLSVRRLEAGDWRAYRDLRLRALADSPDAFGSLLEYEQPRDDAEWRERVGRAAGSTGQLPLFAIRAGTPIGLVWGRIDPSRPEIAHVYQMWVAPEHRGTGAATMLLDALIEWALEVGAESVELTVTTGDTPAMRLNTRAGFRRTGEFEPLRPGSSIRTQRMQLDLVPKRTRG